MSFFNKALLIFAGLTLLVSCGFHLRGKLELSDEITPIFIVQSGEDNALNRDLQELLVLSGGSLAKSRSDAKTVLSIISTNTKRRVVAVDTQGRAQQYEMRFIVRYSVTGESITQIGSDNIKVISLRRELTFDPDNVLAVGHETDRLYKAMREESARLILQRLQALDLQLKNSDNTGEQTSD